MLAFGLFILWAGLDQGALKSIRLSRSGIEVIGEVVSVDERHSDCDSCPGRTLHIFESHYQFTLPDGQTIRSSKDFRSEPGDKVRVIYNPSNPHDNRLADDRQANLIGSVMTTLGAGFLGLFIGGCGVGLIAKGWKEYKTGIRES